MPSLSILAMNPGGIMIVPDEPGNIPIVPEPSVGGGTGPRIQSVGPSDIPVTPLPLPGAPGPRIQSNEPDDIPIISNPGNGDPGPRIMSVGDDGIDDGGLIDLGFGGVRPRQDIDPNLIPVTPHPNPNPNPGHEPRIRSVVQYPECYHYDGVVYIYADNTITYINASVTRYDDNQVWSNAGSGNTLSITASDASGEYYLELTLSSGQSYIGKYIIE
jgi:hypothetical protein